jgi:hypothetical protein
VTEQTPEAILDDGLDVRNFFFDLEGFFPQLRDGGLQKRWRTFGGLHFEIITEKQTGFG